jgi:hypothetical protein
LSGVNKSKHVDLAKPVLEALAFKMSKRKKQKNRLYVDHPRFGNKPISSGHNYSKEQIERAHWRYSRLEYFPETAIPANIDRQKYSIYPRSLYVDILEHCNVCHRPFIFFAKEQQYWFERLGFWVDAHCTRCFDCRHKDHEIKAMQRKYEALVSKSDRSESESRELKQVALELYQIGYIRDIEKINQIKLTKSFIGRAKGVRR